MRLEAHLVQQAQPGGPLEQAAHVPVVHASRRLPHLAQQIGEVHDVRAIRGVRIPGPHEVPQAAAGVVMPVRLGGIGEVLAQFVRREDGHPAWPAVPKGGLHGLP